jgi:myo-inositol 2-dehydrogenase/D-chiro-inositol 1-dehydrogenase
LRLLDLGVWSVAFLLLCISSTTDSAQGKRHVHTLLYRVPCARVVAVCSSTPEEVQWAKDNSEYKEFGIAVYDKFEEMLDHSGLQAVWISTSTDVHASQSLSAIAKGLHVLCEKPLSTGLNEVSSILPHSCHCLFTM